MKNFIKCFLCVCLVMLLTIVALNTASTIKADSGWDTDYDSGGSSSSSSSSSSFGSSHSSSHSDYSNTIALDADLELVIKVVGISVALIMVILIILLLIKTSDTNNDNEIYKLSEEEANKVIPNFDIEEFNKQAYQIFYDVQMAWMNFDYDKLKEFLIDELYNSYVMQLEALKVKCQKNIMKEFVLKEVYIFALKEENGHYIAEVYLDVEFYDYVENIKNKKIVRGKSNIKVNNFYTLTFICTKEKSHNINECPNCGAEVKGNATGTCKHCKSKLINKTYNWVMSKKEKIDQK